MHILHPYLWGHTDGHLFTHYSGISSHSQGSSYKKKQESLSPEDRDLFEKNNTAAQHKYHYSLSPVQKAQVLTNNAAEHKKLQKSLSPEQKGQIKSVDAAAH